MSVRAAPLNTAAADLGTAISEVQPEAAALAEGNSFTTQSSETPLTRNIVVSIRASLNDLCLQKSKGSWAPSPEALKSIFQAKKFTSLEGTQEAQGDLKSVVLHSMKLQHVKSSFPLSVGAEISAVDNDCFSATGKPFSFIALSNAESSSERTLQEDDISLAYEFASKFPVRSAFRFARKFAFARFRFPSFLQYRSLDTGDNVAACASCRASHVAARRSLVRKRPSACVPAYFAIRVSFALRAFSIFVAILSSSQPFSSYFCRSASTRSCSHASPCNFRLASHVWRWPSCLPKRPSLNCPPRVTLYPWPSRTHVPHASIICCSQWSRANSGHSNKISFRTLCHPCLRIARYNTVGTFPRNAS